MLNSDRVRGDRGLKNVKVFSMNSVPESGPLLGGGFFRRLITDKDTDLFSLGFVTMEPGKGHVWHYTHQSDEAMYILTGKGTISWKENGTVESLKYKKGDVIFIRKGIHHQNINTGKETITLISIIAPYAFAVLERQE